MSPRDDAASALGALAAEIASCQACALGATRTNTVPGVGTAPSGLVLCGEGPGEREDAEGLPFVGRSGQLLDRLLAEELGFTRADVAIVNVVKCRPPGNRDPLPGEVEACQGFLRRQLEILEPAVLVTLGNVATRAVTGRREGITALRGQVLEALGVTVLPTFHPAAALRGGVGVLAAMRADLVRAKRLLTA